MGRCTFVNVEDSVLEEFYKIAKAEISQKQVMAKGWKGKALNEAMKDWIAKKKRENMTVPTTITHHGDLIEYPCQDCGAWVPKENTDVGYVMLSANIEIQQVHSLKNKP